jgi:hypothetical protein
MLQLLHQKSSSTVDPPLQGVSERLDVMEQGGDYGSTIQQHNLSVGRDNLFDGEGSAMPLVDDVRIVIACCNLQHRSQTTRLLQHCLLFGPNIQYCDIFSDLESRFPDGVNVAKMVFFLHFKSISAQLLHADTNGCLWKKVKPYYLAFFIRKISAVPLHTG